MSLDRKNLLRPFGLACMFLGLALPASAMANKASVVIVRQKPTAPYRTVYVIYSGSLSEMVTAEIEVHKVLGKRGVAVFGASEDVSDIQQITDKAITSKIANRLSSADQPSVMLTIKQIKARERVIIFSLFLLDPANGKEVGVGELSVDTDNQPTLFYEPEQATRIAIRDVCRRFLTDKRILHFFGSAP